jgi:hypothetical protein
MTKKISFLAVLIGVLVLAGGLFAFTQTVTPATPQPVTEAIIITILGASIFGMPLSALAELLKRLLLKYLHFPDKPWTGYLVSAITVAAGCYVVLKPLGMMNTQNFLTGFIIAWASANGFYKITVKAAQEKTAAQIAGVMGGLKSLAGGLEEAKSLIKFNGPFAALGKDTAPEIEKMGAPSMKDPSGRPITGFGQ